jgi:surface polysaccharide O-acyltransferase-like enzyme
MFVLQTGYLLVRDESTAVEPISLHLACKMMMIIVMIVIVIVENDVENDDHNDDDHDDDALSEQINIGW